jgi:hypothetical protein
VNLRHRPSFAASTMGAETVMVFVLPDELLVAVVTRDLADDIAALAERMRDLDINTLLEADPANRRIPVPSIAEAVCLPSAGPYDIELKLEDGKPFRLRFETRNDRDTIFQELADLVGDRVPFFREPPSRLAQMTSPLVLALLFGALGVGSYIWFSNIEAAANGSPRMHVLIKWLWNALGKEGILGVLAGVGGVFLLMAAKRLFLPRRRQAVAAPRTDDAETD